MIWLILLGILSLLFWYNFVRPLNHFKNMGIKDTNPWIFFGDNWKTVFGMRSFFELIDDVYKFHSNTRYTGFYQFMIPTLALRDPELIKQITVKDFDYFTDHRPFIDPECDPLFGRNLFSLKGHKWREMRATLSGSFTSSKMKNMFHLMNEAAENFVKFFINKNEDLLEVELKDTFTRYTNDVIATTAFGIKIDSLNEPNNEFYAMGKKVTNLNTLTQRLKFFGYFVIPKIFKWFGVKFLDGETSDFFAHIIDENIKAREEKGIVRQDMIQLLLESRKGTKLEDVDENNKDTGFSTVEESKDIYKFRQIKNLTDLDITSQAMIFFFAGFDTISTVICFGAYELATNKDIQDKLRKEVMETHKANNEKLTYEALLKMKYLDMVVSEILRKWPAGPGIDRVCTKPYTIEPVLPDEKPIDLKPGDIVFLPIIGLHRDPQYFPNPDRFDPERFSDENNDLIQPYTYIPFGSGPRNCIGNRFALLEIKALLYYLLLNFSIEPTAKSVIPLQLDPKVFNPTCKGGFWFGLKPIVKS